MGMALAFVVECIAKEKQGNAVLAIYCAVKAFSQLYISNKMERFSFKVGVAFG